MDNKNRAEEYLKAMSLLVKAREAMAHADRLDPQFKFWQLQNEVDEAWARVKALVERDS